MQSLGKVNPGNSTSEPQPLFNHQHCAHHRAGMRLPSSDAKEMLIRLNFASGLSGGRVHEGIYHRTAGCNGPDDRALDIARLDFH